MRCDVVEGEPGIFPEPVARVMRKIGGLFGGKRDRAADTDTGEPRAGEPAWGDLDPTPPTDEQPPGEPPVPPPREP